MTHEDIKLAVTEAMQDQMKDFYIERETHYQDHQFIAELRKFTEACKIGFVGSVVSWLVKILFYLVLGGFIFWIISKDVFKVFR